jgi:hypothetical protein
MQYGNACGCQNDLISIAQFDLDQQQKVSSPQTECNSLLSEQQAVSSDMLLVLQGSGL